MANLTADRYRVLIIDECNDEGDTIATNIDDWWTMYSEITPIHRQYLYVKRHAITALLGEERKKVRQRMRDNTVTNDKDQLIDTLETMLKAVNDMISVFERGGAAGSTSGGWGRTPARA